LGKGFNPEFFCSDARVGFGLLSSCSGNAHSIGVKEAFVTDEGITNEEFEAIKARVAAAFNPDGSFRATTAGNNYRSEVGHDVLALIAEVERLAPLSIQDSK
jgi:hypothetical protein